MAQKEKMTVEAPSDASTMWKLIELGQYDQIAELLEETLRSELADHQALKPVLNAARLACWACHQCQIEVERHRQATDEATRRRNELNQQLYLLLNQVEDVQMPEVKAKSMKSLTGSDSKTWSLQKVEWFTSPAKPQEQPETSSTSLAIYCLGAFRVVQADQLLLDWSSLKARAIFKYLVTHPETPVARDILMDLFWPEADPESARRNLHQAIYSLRQTLKQGCPEIQLIQFEPDGYRLNPELKLWTDVAEFERHVKTGQRLESAGQLAEAMTEYSLAETLYQGDFLAEDLYEDWPLGCREYLRAVYIDLASRLAEYYLQQGQYTTAIKLCQKILSRDNCHEETHRRLMECYRAQGQRSLAIRQYQACLHVLRAELDVPPSPEIQALYKQIVSGTMTFVVANPVAVSV